MSHKFHSTLQKLAEKQQQRCQIEPQEVEFLLRFVEYIGEFKINVYFYI